MTMKSNTLGTAVRDGATTLSSSVSRVLTGADHRTLSHLLKAGIGEHTLRATRSDLAYLEAWSLACDGEALPWPPTEEIALRFIAHHLWDPDERAIDASHGMPEHVRTALMSAGFLRSHGPHSPSTVQRRIATWRSLCKWRGVEHVFGQFEVQKTLRAAIRASRRPRERKSRKAVDLDLMEALLNHLDALCANPIEMTKEAEGDRLRAIRDRAILAVMFASGGRRRSEISNLNHSDVTPLPPIETTSTDWPEGIPSTGLSLGRTKTTDAGDAAMVFLSGRAADALTVWRTAVRETVGPVFKRIDRWGNVSIHGVSPSGINQILKARLAEIGEDPVEYSAHGVRAGYITTALKEGIPAPEVMEQTLHRSLDTLVSYFKDEKQRQGRAARLL